WQGNGPLLASGSHDGVLALWAPARSSKPVVALPLTTPVSSLHWSPDDTWLVCGTGSGSLGRFDAR
ncbi:MAG: WD40 repeat domain-containing protein, partial [Chloroflexota bacterium]